MGYRNFISTSFKEFIIEKNQYNKLIVIDDIDPIRKKNRELDKILSQDIFENKGVYLKGGAARIALEIHINNEEIDSFIRDIDYCFIGDYDEYLKVRKNSNLEIQFEGTYVDNYFKNRDITLNEVLLNREKLIFTRRAYRDFEKGVINPKDRNMRSRLASRVLLFSVRYNYKVPTSLDVNNEYKYDFDYLICLLKAYELGIQERYFSICKEYKITDHESLPEWLAHLLMNVYDFNLFGREEYIADDISSLGDVKEELYDMYPELEEEVKNINMYDEDYLDFFRKRNRINKS